MRIRSFAAAAVILLLSVNTALAAPKSDLWPRWTAHDPQSTRVIDHSAWSRLLARHIKTDTSGLNRFDYQAVDRDDRRLLDGYIDGLSGTPVSRLNRDEQMAYWINLYNALTIQVVLAHYPVESIKDIRISPGFFSSGPWGAELVTVEGERLTLDDIEHRILRPIWQDPRIHYGVNCAAVGCPNLAGKAYTAATLDEMLDAGAVAFVNNPRGVRVRNGRLRVSSIYDWFEEDFGGNDAGVIAHIKQYARPELLAQLGGIRSVSGDSYDWMLNDVNDHVDFVMMDKKVQP